jgi:hypothetical protein
MAQQVDVVHLEDRSAQEPVGQPSQVGERDVVCRRGRDQRSRAGPGIRNRPDLGLRQRAKHADVRQTLEPPAAERERDAEPRHGDIR